MPRPASSGQLLPQLPEDRLFGRQESESSQASAVYRNQLSESEKRLQDTPLRINSEPAHITPGILRSVGSGAALAAMAEEPEVPPALRSVGSGLALAAMAPDNDAPPALRSVGSGLALAAMAAAAEQAEHFKSGSTTPLGRVGSGLALAAMAAQDVYVTQLSGDAEQFYRDQAAEGVADAGPLRKDLHLADMLHDSGIKVKNTFLEFDEPRQQKAGLRQVHTAAGRLDVMG